MVKVSDCTCCDCDSAQEKEQIKERALSSINKVYTFDNRTYWPDGTGMVTLPIPSADQITQMEKNTEFIKANTADITALNAEMEDVQGTVGKIPTGYTLYRDGEGKIRLQAEATDGSLINSNVLDMIIPYQYDLISGTTDRSFKLNITMSDGSSYTTNDFVIPEGGGTDVTVTGIVLSKDQGDVNRFHVGINLSDSTMIDSGYISMVDNVAATYADGKLTISVNGVSSVPVAVDVTGEFTAGDGIKIENGTISISDELAQRLTTIESDITNVLTVANRAFDAVTLADNVLTLERGNGGTESVTLPSGGNDWEELDLTNLPTDFTADDEILICIKPAIELAATQQVVNCGYPVYLKLLTSSTASNAFPICGISFQNTWYFNVGYINPSIVVRNWNETDTTVNVAYRNFFSFHHMMLGLQGVGNSGGITHTSEYVTRDNISNYVMWIKRKKATS